MRLVPFNYVAYITRQVGIIMNRKVNVILGLGIALMAAVAVFVLFSYAFNDSSDLNFNGASVFNAMFGSTDHEINAVPGLIIAFSFELAGFVFAIAAGIFKGKMSSLLFGLTFAFLLTAGILFLNTVNLYMAVNPYAPHTEGVDVVSLGSGSICTVVFAFVGALLSLYGAYSNWKA